MILKEKKRKTKPPPQLLLFASMLSVKETNLQTKYDKTEITQGK